MKAWRLSIAMVVFLVGQAARASPSDAAAPSRAWHLGAEVGTDFPVEVGGTLRLEGPYGLRLSTTLGGLPGIYVDAINGVLVAANSYSQRTADLVRAVLTSSLVWRTHIGMRPLAGRGLYFELGYGLVTLGGGVTDQQLIIAGTGKSPPPDIGMRYDVSSTIHMLDVELGWQWLLRRHLTLRGAVGLAATVGSSTTVTPNFHPLLPGPQEVFTRGAADYLDHVYRTYVFTPVVTLAVGWRLF